MNIHCFQHLTFENPGTIKEWAEHKGHNINYTLFYEDNFLLPDVKDMDALLIMGGYMNVDEEEQFPWLKEEKRFIKKAIDAGKKVIGICLGSQLIAASPGAKVYPGKEKEIGFFPVTFTDEALHHTFFNHFTNPYTVFHWHGDTFNLPVNAQLIASTDVCKHQAFTIGSNVLALQFHFEMNKEIVEDMLLHDAHELEEEGTYIQTKDEIRKAFHYLQQNKQDLFLLLDKFFAA
ncbi:MAG: amidotransferase [Chitinophagaceae bacterium]|nr:amidotransferase [Chitinophagaceae bacterium]